MAGQKTALYSRKQSGGVFHIEDQSLSTGSRFYVHAGTGGTAANGFGFNPDSPLTTIDAAVALCTANKNDIIYVMPGHAETISAAADIALDVAGISVIGLGNGANRPTVTMGTIDSVDIDVDAANVTIQGIRFLSAIDDIVAGIDVNAVNCTIRDCEFLESADDKNFLICILGGSAATSDRLTVEDCYVIQDDASNTHFVSLPGTSKGCVINNNIIMGDFGTAAIGVAGVTPFIQISGNEIFNIATTVDGCINLAATATGIVTRNLCGGGAAVVNGVTATACTEAENYYQITTSDLSGVLDPANA